MSGRHTNAHLPCSTKGCKNVTRCGRCKACYLKDMKAKADARAGVSAAARRAAGVETEADVVKRDNVLLRADLAATRAVVKKLDDRAQLEDRLLQEVSQYIRDTPYRPSFTPFKHKAVSPGEHEMLLALSDAHFPEVVNPDEAMGLSYGPETCRRRLEHVRDTVIRYRDLRAKAYPTRKLTVVVNGDMLSGNIHEELEVTNAFPMSEALVKMAYMLLDMGLAWRSAFPEVELIVMPGNHPRLTKKPRSKGKWDNWEWVLGQFVKALAGDRFAVTVPKAIVHAFPIFGKRIGASHGDGVKAQSFAGIPHYAMKTRRDAMQALLKSIGEPTLDMLLYGHFHQLIYDEGSGCSLVINGSVKGGDEYGITTRYSAPSAVQALMTFHPKHGMTDLSRINLDAVVAEDDRRSIAS